jgi:hypothetical protein
MWATFEVGEIVVKVGMGLLVGGGPLGPFPSPPLQKNKNITIKTPIDNINTLFIFTSPYFYLNSFNSPVHNYSSYSQGFIIMKQTQKVKPD